MGKAKRFYWLKLEVDFFKTKEMKKLRRQAGGDTYVIIALEMSLLSLKSDCKIIYEGVEENIADEIALELDEEPGNVRVTLNYLMKCGWIRVSEDDTILLDFAADRTGSESESAARVRKHRAEKELRALQCNDDVTQVQQGVTPMSQNCNDRVKSIEYRDKITEYKSTEYTENDSFSCGKPDLSTEYENSSTEFSTGGVDFIAGTSRIRGAVGYYARAFGGGSCPEEVQRAMLQLEMSNQSIVDLMRRERYNHPAGSMGKFLIKKSRPGRQLPWA